MLKTQGGLGKISDFGPDLINSGDIKAFHTVVRDEIGTLPLPGERPGKIFMKTTLKIN
jgi:hypothetical protein